MSVSGRGVAHRLGRVAEAHRAAHDAQAEAVATHVAALLAAANPPPSEYTKGDAGHPENDQPPASA